MADKKRPILIAIIAILTMISGILMIIAGLLGGTAVFTIDLFIGTEFENWMAQLGVGMLLMGIIAFIIGFGFWKGWKIMWIIAVILYLISVIMLLIAMVLTLMSSISLGWSLIIPLVICLLILFYLTRPKVKEFFGIGG